MGMVPIKEVADILNTDEQSLIAQYPAMGAVKHISGTACLKFSMLPPDIQARLRDPNGAEPEPAPLPLVPPPLDVDLSLQGEVYADAPDFNRAERDRRAAILNDCAGLSGKELDSFIARRKESNPSEKISVGTIYRWRKIAASGASDKLIGQYGKRRGYTLVPDELFEIFVTLHAKEGGPSVSSCYDMVRGMAKKRGYDLKTLPSASAFNRRYLNEYPEEVRYRSKYGAKAANRKYNFYVKRDTGDLLAGECWVADHAQIDGAVTCTVNGKEKVVFPWLTTFADFKSHRFLGAYLHHDAPDSDDIFTAFYRAAVAHGVPSYFYFDNGKDFRCKDLSGGRRIHKWRPDKGKTTALADPLGITTIFAENYNAQAKIIERLFLVIKERFSKHYDGYRGGNVVERPEILKANIAAGKILSIEDFEVCLNLFIEKVMSETEVSSGNRKGQTPLEIWNKEYPIAAERGIVKRVTKDALKLFCCRSSSVVSIGRRGVHCGECNVDYYASWMEGQRGRKVYMRRDPAMMCDAFIFDADNNEYLGQGFLLDEVAAIAVSDEQRAVLAQALETKRTAQKIQRMLSHKGTEIPFQEKISALAENAKSLSEEAGRMIENPKSDLQTMLTPMDIALAKKSEMEKEGTVDLSVLGLDSLEPRKPPLPHFPNKFERDEAIASGKYEVVSNVG
jgi:putative transposase